MLRQAPEVEQYVDDNDVPNIYIEERLYSESEDWRGTWKEDLERCACQKRGLIAPLGAVEIVSIDPPHLTTSIYMIPELLSASPRYAKSLSSSTTSLILHQAKSLSNLATLRNPLTRTFGHILLSFDSLQQHTRVEETIYLSSQYRVI